MRLWTIIIPIFLLFLVVGCAGDTDDGPLPDENLTLDEQAITDETDTAYDPDQTDQGIIDDTIVDDTIIDDTVIPDDTVLPDNTPADNTVLPDEDVVDETVVPDDAVPSDDCELDDAHRYACCVFEQVNIFRSQAGLGLIDYVYDTKLAEVGFYYAGYMADNNTFAHSADGINFGQRLDNFSVAWVSAGENLQRNSRSSWESACQETVWGSGGWVNSTQGHREAMLGQDTSGTPKGWTHAGAGVAKSGGYWYVAMYFVKY